MCVHKTAEEANEWALHFQKSKSRHRDVQNQKKSDNIGDQQTKTNEALNSLSLSLFLSFYLSVCLSVGLCLAVFLWKGTAICGRNDPIKEP